MIRQAGGTLEDSTNLSLRGGVPIVAIDVSARPIETEVDLESKRPCAGTADPDDIESISV